MKASARLSDPELAEVTISVTMSVGEWREVKRSLAGADVPGQLGMVIGRALDATIERVDQRFTFGPYFTKEASADD